MACPQWGEVVGYTSVSQQGGLCALQRDGPSMIVVVEATLSVMDRDTGRGQRCVCMFVCVCVFVVGRCR